MKIYTKKGDKGDTRLLYGDAVSKDSIAPEAYGSVDELVAALGLIRYEKDLPLKTKEIVLKIQRELFEDYLLSERDLVIHYILYYVNFLQENVLENLLLKFS